jgi:hypothetical protein
MPAGGSSQKLQLFMRAKAMSGAPIIIGIIQLAKPTKAGMIAPNTMIRPCSVIIWLKNSGSTTCSPGWNSSARMIRAIAPPTMNMAKLNHRYIVPMSLWLVVNSQRLKPRAGPRHDCHAHGLGGVALGDGGHRWCSVSVLFQVAGACWLASHASNSAFGRASTTIGMKPWSLPHSSAHWPR